MRSLLATASGWWRVTHDAIREIGGAEGFQIAFVIMAICVVCPVGAAAWQRSHVPPVSYARVDPPQSTKRQDKLLMARAVQTEKLTAEYWVPMSCARLAIREREAMPTNKSEIKAAKQKVETLARKGDRLARECLKDMEKMA